MQRKDVNIKDTWDLTKFFKDEKEYNKLYKETKKLLKEIVTYKDKITKDSDTFYNFLVLDNKISYNEEKIYVYSYLYHYQDTSDSLGKKYKVMADDLVDEVGVSTSFIKSELLSNDYKYILSLIDKDKRLEKYKFSLEEMFRYKEHILSKKEEEIITLAATTFGSGDNAFSALDNADCKFDKVIVDGKETELNHSNYITLMGNKNRKVREEVFKKYYKFYIEHKNTIAEMYLSQLKQDSFYYKVRKFNSALEESLFGDAVDVSVYKNLVNTIHNNLDSMYKYLDFRKDYLKLDKLHMYDIYVDLIDGESKKFSFDDAENVLFEALKVLGPDYIELLKKAFKDRWVDRYPNDGKRSGAYQWGIYGIDPYVSLNFDGTEDSVSTLAHELGHAMHSYYSNSNQDYIYAGYPIILAEIASTVNEVLVNEYMIRNASSDEEKLLYITSFLDKFRATVYRQTMFAEFEMIVHEKIEKHEVVTGEVLADTYYDLNKLYYGKDVVSDEEIKYEWSRIPHFYTPFYVYKYATGFSCAIYFAKSILDNKEGALENYKNFLKSGGSDYPLNILKKCGIDLNTTKPIDDAISMFNDKLNEAIAIVNKGGK